VAKRKILGCSFPVVIIIGILLIAAFIFSLAGGPIGSKLISTLFHVNFTLPTWLAVPQPSIELPPEAIAHFGSFPIMNSMITAWISIIVIVLLSFFAFRRMKFVPSGLQGVMEFIYGALLSFCVSVAGEKNGRRFFPVMATIFLFVIVNAWMGLIPGYSSLILHEANKAIPVLRPANTDVNVPLAIAIFSFVAVEYFGLKTLGISYVTKFINTRRIRKGIGYLFKGKIKPALSGILFGAIDVFVGLLEGLSEFIRIVSFTFRLFGNMTAGEILLLMIGFLVPLVISLPFYVLEIVVGLVQALIFGGLTLVFMTLAVAGHDEEASE
jgi:F-type H+-transporting ATPase subunit a